MRPNTRQRKFVFALILRGNFSKITSVIAIFHEAKAKLADVLKYYKCFCKSITVGHVYFPIVNEKMLDLSVVDNLALLLLLYQHIQNLEHCEAWMLCLDEVYLEKTEKLIIYEILKSFATDKKTVK